MQTAQRRWFERLRIVLRRTKRLVARRANAIWTVFSQLFPLLLASVLGLWLIWELANRPAWLGYTQLLGKLTAKPPTIVAFAPTLVALLAVGVSAIALVYGWKQSVVWPQFARAVEFKLAFVERQLRDLYGPLYGIMQRSGAYYFATLRYLGVDSRLLPSLGFDRTRNLQRGQRLLMLDAYSEIARAHDQLLDGKLTSDPKHRAADHTALDFSALAGKGLVRLNGMIRKLLVDHQDLISPNRFDRPSSFTRFVRHEAEFRLFVQLADLAHSRRRLAAPGTDEPRRLAVRRLGRLGRDMTTFPADLFEHVQLKHELLLQLQNKYRSQIEYRSIRMLWPTVARAIKHATYSTQAVVLWLGGGVATSALAVLVLWGSSGWYASAGASKQVMLESLYAVTLSATVACFLMILISLQHRLAMRLIDDLLKVARTGNKGVTCSYAIGYHIRSVWADAGRVQRLLLYRAVEAARRDVGWILSDASLLVYASGDLPEGREKLSELYAHRRHAELALKATFLSFPDSDPTSEEQWQEARRYLPAALDSIDRVVSSANELTKCLAIGKVTPTRVFSPEDKEHERALVVENTYRRIHQAVVQTTQRVDSTSRWLRTVICPTSIPLVVQKHSLPILLCGRFRLAIKAIESLLDESETDFEVGQLLLEDLSAVRGISDHRRLRVVERRARIGKRLLREAIARSDSRSKPIATTFESLRAVRTTLEACRPKRSVNPRSPLQLGTVRFCRHSRHHYASLA